MYHISFMSSVGSNSDCDGKSGLAHVCEHCAIIHHMNTHMLDSDSAVTGKTDFHSCALFYSMQRKHVAAEQQSLIEDIVSGEYLTSKSFETAKQEVLAECLKRLQYDNNMVKIMSFVTDGEICRMPTGILQDIQSITLDDARKGNPFGIKGSLAYVEYDSSEIHRLVYMPGTNVHSNLRNIRTQRSEAKVLGTEGSVFRLYLAMPTCMCCNDILQRAIAEFILRQRMRSEEQQIARVFHKFLFQRSSHLVVDFVGFSKIHNNTIHEILKLLSAVPVAEEELVEAKRSIIESDMTIPIIEKVRDIQSFLSYGSPSIFLEKQEKIIESVKAISTGMISDFLHDLFLDVHVVIGKDLLS